MKKRNLLIYIILAIMFPVTMLGVLGFNLSPLLPIIERVKNSLPF